MARLIISLFVILLSTAKTVVSKQTLPTTVYRQEETPPWCLSRSLFFYVRVNK